jgi:hypothetical protein
MISARSVLVPSVRTRIAQSRPFICAAILLLLAASPALVRAQFQSPTDEELKMTADPQAPGADAIYLYREEITDDVFHYQTFYERIKILTEKGKEQATIRIPYYRNDFKISDIKGRTIHAEGTIIPLATRPSDLIDFKSKSVQVNQMVFTMPSAEVGSIVEYSLKVVYDDNFVFPPNWSVQQPLFVRKAHYMFTPSQYGDIQDQRGNNANRLMYTTVGFPHASVDRDGQGRYILNIANVPAIPTDDWMPPLNTRKWKLEFYYTYAPTGKDYWDAEGKVWARNAERFTNPSNQLKQAVAQIVAPTDSDEQKARKIYAAVMKLDNTRFSRAKSAAERSAGKLKPLNSAEEVWKQQSGSDDDMALLFVALGRAAALKVWPMEVVDRSRAILDLGDLRTGQLDDYIAIVELGGKEIYVDPGQKMCPFGALDWKHTLTAGFRLMDKAAKIQTIPGIDSGSSVVSRSADLTLDESGNLTGRVQIVMSGPEALHWRQLSIQNDQEEVKKQFNESLHNYLPEGVQADFDHFLALDDYESNLMAIVKVSGNIGSTTGRHFFLPGLFFESHATHPFVAQDKRTIAVDVHYPLIEKDEVTYYLPQGFKVESMPQEAITPWANHAVLNMHSSAKDDAVTIRRLLARNFTLLNPNDYTDLRAFYMKVATTDQQQLVLTRASDPKGN